MIKIPFYARFEEPLRNGTKSWTTRSKQYVKKGERFEAFDMCFECDTILELELWRVGLHWREEGCKSRGDFMTLWEKIHYRVGWLPDKKYVVHIFHRVY